MTKYLTETTLKTKEKVELIKKFLNENYSSLDCTFTTGWYELIDLYGMNNLSQEFRDSMEKEIDSIYVMIIESEFYKKKETRIPAFIKKDCFTVIWINLLSVLLILDIF